METRSLRTSSPLISPVSKHMYRSWLAGVSSDLAAEIRSLRTSSRDPSPVEVMACSRNFFEIVKKASAILGFVRTRPTDAGRAQIEEMRKLLRQDAIIATSAITPIEITSALWRQRHSTRLALDAHQNAEATFAELSERWIEVTFSAALVEISLRLVTRHSLRSLDAIQLASALLLADAPRNL